MEEQVKPSAVALRYGLIIGLIMIVYGLVLQLTGLYQTQALAYVNYVILIVGFVLAHNAFKNQGDGYMSYGQGMSIAAVLTLVAAAISSIFSYLYITLVDDSMIQWMKDEAMRQWEEEGLSDEAIAQAEKFSGFFMSPTGLLIMGIVGTFIFGIILALIVTAITKNSSPDTDVA